MAFVAGFVDAMVGGGGLIQTPFTMALLPGCNASTLIGSLINCIALFYGSSIGPTTDTSCFVGVCPFATESL